MPCVDMKIEATATAQNPSESFNPVKQLQQAIEKKIRNLEKRRHKLTSLQAEQKQGKELEPEQLEAISHIGAVDWQIDVVKDFNKQINLIAQDAAKTAKLQKRQELKERSLEEQAKLREMLRIQELLNAFGDDDTREDFKTGESGAKVLSEEDLTRFDTLYDLISVNRTNVLEAGGSWTEALDSAAQHAHHLITASNKPVPDMDNVTYKDMKALIDEVASCGYFQTSRAPSPGPEETDDQSGSSSVSGDEPGDANVVVSAASSGGDLSSAVSVTESTPAPPDVVTEGASAVSGATAGAHMDITSSSYPGQPGPAPSVLGPSGGERTSISPSMDVVSSVGGFGDANGSVLGATGMMNVAAGSIVTSGTGQLGSNLSAFQEAQSGDLGLTFTANEEPALDASNFGNGNTVNPSQGQSYFQPSQPQDTMIGAGVPQQQQQQQQSSQSSINAQPQLAGGPPFYPPSHFAAFSANQYQPQAYMTGMNMPSDDPAGVIPSSKDQNDPYGIVQQSQYSSNGHIIPGGDGGFGSSMQQQQQQQQQHPAGSNQFNTGHQEQQPPISVAPPVEIPTTNEPPTIDQWRPNEEASSGEQHQQQFGGEYGGDGQSQQPWSQAYGGGGGRGGRGGGSGGFRGGRGAPERSGFSGRGGRSFSRGSGPRGGYRGAGGERSDNYGDPRYRGRGGGPRGGGGPPRGTGDGNYRGNYYTGGASGGRGAYGGSTVAGGRR